MLPWASEVKGVELLRLLDRAYPRQPSIAETILCRLGLGDTHDTPRRE